MEAKKKLPLGHFLCSGAQESAKGEVLAKNCEPFQERNGGSPRQRRRGTSDHTHPETGHAEGLSVPGRGNGLGEGLEAGGGLEGLEESKGFRMAVVCVRPCMCMCVHVRAFTHVRVWYTHVVDTCRCHLGAVPGPNLSA